MTLHACTIVARNYLPHARVLATSFLEHHPGARFTTLVIDDRRRETGPDEPFEVLHLDELVPGADALHLLATYYDVMELATAVKPLLLMHLLKRTADAVAYLDPDIEVHGDLSPVERAAQGSPVVLTPHTTVPYPRDGLRPTEAEIMGAGIYNLGFIAVAHGAEPFLRWWWERLERDAVVDPARMLFTDQRWIDFVPALFEPALLKDPGLNVAYWNLHGRDLAGSGDAGWTVDGGPLRFFHFSGYSPFRPQELSKHTGDHPRVRLADDPALAELATAYGHRLLGAGLVETGGPAYGWRGEDGLVLDAGMRRAFQAGVRASDGSGQPPPPHPFGGDGGTAFLDWLRTPAGGRRWPSVNRYLAAVHALRPDLQRAFPEGDRGAERDYLRWAAQGALALEGRAASLVAPAGAAAPAAAVPAAALPSTGGLPAVQAVGYFRAELGMGEYGRQLVEALAASGAAVGTTTWAQTLSRQQHPFEDRTTAEVPRVNVLVVNADQTPGFVEAAGPDFFTGRHTVGAWAWEVDDFPAEYDAALALVDEVWAISDHTRDAVARRTSKPVHSVPPPVPSPAVDPTITRADLGLPEGFLFLFSLDFLSVPRRKNALGLVEAFCRAFAPGEGPVLVVKSINGDRLPADRAALHAAVADRPDVLLVDSYFTADQRTALMGHADCYVSLHRSEGLGLTMAESMALGKPVIATGYSGNLTFMDEHNSLLVPYDLVPIGPGAAPYSPTATWAEPRLDVAAALMRQVWSDPGLAARVGARAAADIAEKHSPAARAELVRGLLTGIAGRLPAAGTAHAAPAEVTPTALQRRLARARFLAHVARTPEMRRAAVRRRLGNAVSAGFGQSRRALAEQEATRRQVVALRGQVEHVTQELDGELRRRREADAAATTRLTALQDAATSGRQEAEQRLQAVEARLEQPSPADAALPQVADRLDAAEHRLNEGDAVTALTTRRLDELGERLDRLALTVERVEDELDAAPYTSDPAALRVPGLRGTTLGYLDGPDSSYADFEDLFRGTEALIRDRQRAYLPLLQDAAPVLDLGCGRGELLSVLAEAGVAASGVDLDASMVERARHLGLDVVEGDALTRLRELDASSLGAVTSFQVVEHLALADLEEVLRLSLRALRPGGLLVAETVNPHSPRALKAFWLDPTHRHPLFPEALLMLARAAGFASAEILFPHGTGDYEADRTTQGEYALLARR